MPALLELTDEFGSVFGAGRGVDASKAQSRDAAIEKAISDRTPTVAKKLCDPDFLFEGLSIVEECEKTFSGAERNLAIQNLLYEEDFTAYLKPHKVFHELEHLEPLRRLVAMLAGGFVYTYSDTNVTLYVRMLRKIGGTEISNDFMYPQAKSRANRMLQTDIMNSLAKDIFSTIDLTYATKRAMTYHMAKSASEALSQYNKSVPIYGRYLCDESWENVVNNWYIAQISDGAEAAHKEMKKTVLLHGVRKASDVDLPASKRSRRSKKDSQRLSAIEREIAILETSISRVLQGLSASAIQGSRKRAHLSRLRKRVTKLREKRKASLANILPSHLRSS